MSDVREEGQAPTVAAEEKLTTARLADTAPKASAPEVAPAEEPRAFAEPVAGKTAPPAQSEEAAAPLFAADEAKNLRAEWDAIQAGFVDEPRRVVQQADELVAKTMKRLAEIFAAERGRLEGQWDRGDDVSTEDLRLALRRYRSFFGRLLSI